jgi:hypothetical protein
MYLYCMLQCLSIHCEGDCVLIQLALLIEIDYAAGSHAELLLDDVYLYNVSS